MKTLLILGIGIWGFMAIINYYGRPAVVEEGDRTMDKSGLKKKSNYDDVEKRKTSFSKPEYS